MYEGAVTAQSICHFASEEIIVFSVQLIPWFPLSQSVEPCKRLSTPPTKRKKSLVMIITDVLNRIWHMCDF